MPLYEHVFMARQDVTSQQVEAMIDQYKGVIEANGGKVDKTEMWGVKSLAYRIKKNRKAHFTMFNLDAPPAAVAEMERQMRISEDILRFITIRVEELEERAVGDDAEARPRRAQGPRAPASATASAASRRGGDRTSREASMTWLLVLRRVSAGGGGPPSVLPSSQDLPVLGPERAEDRLQGHEAALALHLRARQDRAFPHHGGLGQEAARTRPGDQARPLPRPAALRDRLIDPAALSAPIARAGRCLMTSRPAVKPRRDSWGARL